MTTTAKAGAADAAAPSEPTADASPAECQRTSDALLLPVERRRAPRTSNPAHHGVIDLRVRPGHQTVLVNLSLHGAAIETAYRLLPGSTVELQLETRQGRTTMRGRVLRCAVVGLAANQVTYGGGVCFESRLPWLDRDPQEYAVPATAAPAGT